MAAFPDKEKDEDPTDPFSTLKHSIEKARSWDKTLVLDDVICDDILIFNDQVALTQKILINEMIVTEMKADESDTKSEEEKEDKQEPDVSLMKKPSASKMCEALNSLFNFALIKGNKDMQHIAIKPTKKAEMELRGTAQ